MYGGQLPSTFGRLETAGQITVTVQRGTVGRVLLDLQVKAEVKVEQEL